MTDRVTELVWQRAPPPGPLSFDQAIRYCSTLALGAHLDWRAPSRLELASLAKLDRRDPGIDARVFPAGPAGTWLTWSGTEAPGPRGFAWALLDGDGAMANASQDIAGSVRCVRGATRELPRLETDGDTAVDRAAGLRWERRGSPVLLDHAAAVTRCAQLPGGGFRLPTALELQTTFDGALSVPRVDAEVFIDTLPLNYWTSSSVAGYPGHYWAMSMRSGSTQYHVETNLNGVRCVKEER